MGIRTTTARLYFLLPCPSHIGTSDAILPLGDVTAFSPILIHKCFSKWSRWRDSDPHETRFELVASASWATPRNCSSWSTTCFPPTTPLPFRCLILVRCDEKIVVVGMEEVESTNPANFKFARSAIGVHSHLRN